MSGRAPSDPEFERRVRESFAQQRFMRTLGAELVRLVPGEAEIALAVTPEIGQQHGYVHAGAVAAIADSAAGYAVASLAPPGHEVLTVEFKINLTAPAVGERLVARARVLRAGRSLSTAYAEVHARAGAGESLVATLLSTVLLRAGGERR